jgi:hypothetical protein
MTPVTQTRFYEPDLPADQQRGNCLTAVVASLLDLPIEAVPNFVQNHVDTGGDQDWWQCLHAFVREQGHRLFYLRPVETPGASGSTMGFPAPDPGEYYTVSGVSTRSPDIHHIVIYRDGEMVWDPHPDRDGLAEIDDRYHWSLRPIEAVA